MPTEPLKRVKQNYETVVQSAERVTPSMVRLVLTGADLTEFVDLPWADHYVKFVIPESGDLPAVNRSYTVRGWNPETGQLTIDVVVHGSRGRVGPWADKAQPGDKLTLRGQGGSYRPEPDYDWHLMIGDESALPAILVALEQLEPGTKAQAVLEVADAAEEQPINTVGDVQVTWIHRGHAPETESDQGEDTSAGVYGAELVSAVRRLQFLPGAVQVFLHGEAGMVRQLRRHLRGDREINKLDMSVSGYWRLGKDDEAWRAEKSAWKAAVEQDEQQLSAG